MIKLTFSLIVLALGLFERSNAVSSNPPVASFNSATDTRFTATSLITYTEGTESLKGTTYPASTFPGSTWTTTIHATTMLLSNKLYTDSNETIVATTYTGFLGDSTVPGTTKIGSTHAAYTSTYYYNASTTTDVESPFTQPAVTQTAYISTEIVTRPAYCPNPLNYSQSSECTVEWGDNQTRMVAIYFWPSPESDYSCVINNDTHQISLSLPSDGNCPNATMSAGASLPTFASNGSELVTAVTKGYTFTSPSVYLSIGAISGLGITLTDVLLSYAPGELITGAFRDKTAPFNPTDFPCPPCTRLLKDDWYEYKPGDVLSTYGPNIAPPVSKFYSLVPQWGACGCEVDFWAGYDPPTALSKQQALLPVTTSKDPPQTTKDPASGGTVLPETAPQTSQPTPTTLLSPSPPVPSTSARADPTDPASNSNHVIQQSSQDPPQSSQASARSSVDPAGSLDGQGQSSSPTPSASKSTGGDPNGQNSLQAPAASQGGQIKPEASAGSGNNRGNQAGQNSQQAPAASPGSQNNAQASVSSGNSGGNQVGQNSQQPPAVFQSGQINPQASVGSGSNGANTNGQTSPQAPAGPQSSQISPQPSAGSGNNGDNQVGQNSQQIPAVFQSGQINPQASVGSGGNGAGQNSQQAPAAGPGVVSTAGRPSGSSFAPALGDPATSYVSSGNVPKAPKPTGAGSNFDSGSGAISSSGSSGGQQAAAGNQQGFLAQNSAPYYVVANSQTLAAGGSPISISGQVISLGPSGSSLVLGGSTVNIASLQKPATTTFTSNGQIFTSTLNSQVVVGGLTFVPGSVPSNTIVVAPAGTTAVFTENPGQGQVFTVGGSPIAAAPQGSQYIVGGSTLVAGGPAATISGTPVSIAASGLSIVIGSSTLALQSPAGVLKLGSSTITANSAGNFIIGGQTLAPGSAITASGSTVSLSPSGSSAVVDGSMVGLSAAPLTVGGQTLTPAAASGYVIAGQTLSPGGAAVTVNGTLLSLAPSSPGSSGGLGSIIMSGLGGTGTGTPEAFIGSGASVYDLMRRAGWAWMLCLGIYLGVLVRL